MGNFVLFALVCVCHLRFRDLGDIHMVSLVLCVYFACVYMYIYMCIYIYTSARQCPHPQHKKSKPLEIYIYIYHVLKSRVFCRGRMARPPTQPSSAAQIHELPWPLGCPAFDGMDWGSPALSKPATRQVPCATRVYCCARCVEFKSSRGK